MAVSPSLLTSHTLSGEPGNEFSHTIGGEPGAHGSKAAAVVNVHVTLPSICAVPLWSLAPLMLAV